MMMVSEVLREFVGCHASTDPGGEGGERVPVCEGTAGEAVSNGANYGERGGIISWAVLSTCRSSHAWIPFCQHE